MRVKQTIYWRSHSLNVYVCRKELAAIRRVIGQSGGSIQGRSAVCTVFFLMPYEQCGFGGVVRRRGDAIYALNGCDPDDFRFVLSIIAEHSR